MFYKITIVVLGFLFLSCTAQKSWVSDTGKLNPNEIKSMEVRFTQVDPTQKSIYLSGKIIVKESKEPIPGVNLYIVRSKKDNIKAGTTTNLNGEFNLASDNTFPSDSLFIVVVGYHELKYSIEKIINSK